MANTHEPSSFRTLPYPRSQSWPPTVAGSASTAGPRRNTTNPPLVLNPVLYPPRRPYPYPSPLLARLPSPSNSKDPSSALTCSRPCFLFSSKMYSLKLKNSVFKPWKITQCSARCACSWGRTTCIAHLLDAVQLSPLPCSAVQSNSAQSGVEVGMGASWYPALVYPCPALLCDAGYAIGCLVSSCPDSTAHPVRLS